MAKPRQKKKKMMTRKKKKKKEKEKKMWENKTKKKKKKKKRKIHQVPFPLLHLVVRNGNPNYLLTVELVEVQADA